MFVFLSYKSEDANLVRQVAEQLIGCGLDVWVNEYRILAGDYEKFQDGINDGLSRATHAIVFTNNRWAGAEWCRYEMNGLLARIPDRSRIVEVAIPWEDKPREVFPDLLGRPAVVYRGDPRRPSHTGVHDVVVAILDRLGFGTGMTALPATAPRADWLPSYGVTYDPGPFDIWLERSRKQVTARLLQSDAVLGLRTIVYHLAGAKIDVSMDVYVMNYESPISRLSISDTGTSDDRAVYEAYLRYAKQWLPSEHGHFRHVEYKPKGLHLVFVNGTSQIALTYVSEMDNKREPVARWERRYAVRIPNPLADAEGELAFVFSVGLPGDEAQQMRAFCRLAPLFDAVVTSARVRWPSRGQSFVMSVPGFLAKGLTAAGIGYLAWRMSAQDVALWRVAGAAALAGITAGDLGSYLFGKTYRALIRSLRPALSDVLPVSSPRRFITEFTFNLVTLPYVLFGLLARGVVVATTYTTVYGGLLLLAGWAAMFSKKAVLAPPPWLLSHWPALVLGAAAAFGIAASQFARKLVTARYLKVRRKPVDEEQT